MHNKGPRGTLAGGSSASDLQSLGEGITTQTFGPAPAVVSGGRNAVKSEVASNYLPSPSSTLNGRHGNDAADSGDELTEPETVLFPAHRLELAFRSGRPWERPAGRGLTNEGNTCFINATLQCLMYLPPLLNHLTSDDFWAIHRADCSNGPDKKDDCLLCGFKAHVVACFAGTNQRPLTPWWLLHKLHRIAKDMVLGNQEDAHEFLIQLLDTMQGSILARHPQLKGASRSTTVIDQIFGGQMRSQVICLNCKTKSNTYEPFLDIGLDIKSQSDVQGALTQYVTPELLDCGYCCDSCKSKVRATKRLSVHRAPAVLTLQLMRYAGAPNTSKLTHPVSYPEYLDLRPYMTTSGRVAGCRPANRDVAVVYRLHSVTVHDGVSCKSGHYFAFVRAPNSLWFTMNDQNVAPCDVREALRQQAYMLFYVRLEARTAAGAERSWRSPHQTASQQRCDWSIRLANGASATPTNNGSSSGSFKAKPIGYPGDGTAPSSAPAALRATNGQSNASSNGTSPWVGNSGASNGGGKVKWNAEVSNGAANGANNYGGARVKAAPYAVGRGAEGGSAGEGLKLIDGGGVKKKLSLEEYNVKRAATSAAAASSTAAETTSAATTSTTASSLTVPQAASRVAATPSPVCKLVGRERVVFVLKPRVLHPACRPGANVQQSNVNVQQAGVQVCANVIQSSDVRPACANVQLVSANVRQSNAGTSVCINILQASAGTLTSANVQQSSIGAPACADVQQSSISSGATAAPVPKLVPYEEDEGEEGLEGGNGEEVAMETEIVFAGLPREPRRDVKREGVVEAEEATLTQTVEGSDETTQTHIAEGAEGTTQTHAAEGPKAATLTQTVEEADGTTQDEGAEGATLKKAQGQTVEETCPMSEVAVCSRSPYLPSVSTDAPTLLPHISVFEVSAAAATVQRVDVIDAATVETVLLVEQGTKVTTDAAMETLEKVVVEASDENESEDRQDPRSDATISEDRPVKCNAELGGRGDSQVGEGAKRGDGSRENALRSTPHRSRGHSRHQKGSEIESSRRKSLSRSRSSRRNRRKYRDRSRDSHDYREFHDRQDFHGYRESHDRRDYSSNNRSRDRHRDSRSRHRDNRERRQHSRHRSRESRGRCRDSRDRRQNSKDYSRERRIHWEESPPVRGRERKGSPAVSRSRGFQYTRRCR